VTLSMAMLGIGAGAPLPVLGLVSRQAFTRVRGKLLTTGKLGKQLPGGMMLLPAASAETQANIARVECPRRDRW
jgi:cytochrome c-type biogenesis protein